MNQNINFFNQDIPFTLKQKNRIRKWICESAENEDKSIGEITYMFGSDSFILETNRQYLQHDYLTDIITFDYCENNILNGDIAISIERVRENAKTYKVNVEKELLRVLIHGILHLCGYKDKEKEDEIRMRNKEDFYIERFYNNN